MLFCCSCSCCCCCWHCCHHCHCGIQCCVNYSNSPHCDNHSASIIRVKGLKKNKHIKIPQNGGNLETTHPATECHSIVRIIRLTSLLLLLLWDFIWTLHYAWFEIYSYKNYYIRNEKPTDDTVSILFTYRRISTRFGPTGPSSEEFTQLFPQPLVQYPYRSGRLFCTYIQNMRPEWYRY